MPSSPTDRPRDALASLSIDRGDGMERRLHRRSLRNWCIGLTGLILLSSAAGFAAFRAGWLPKSSERFTSLVSLPESLRNTTEVRTAALQVERGRESDTVVVATGYLESRRQAKIGARVPGRIEAVHVEEGTRVKRDDVLAALEHADLDAALAATRASLARATATLAEHEISVDNLRRDYDRAQRLWQAHSLTDAEHDQIKFQRDAAVAKIQTILAEIALAEARVRESEQLKENVFIRAPFDGTVISKDAEVGESILPGGMGEASGRGSVVTIADLSNLEMDCDVKEDYISRVHSEQLALVAVDAVPDRQYQGRVRKIIPMADRARATIKVKVTVVDADERLFPNMSGTVRFLAEPAAAQERDRARIFCPRDALVTDNPSASDDVTANRYVWVLQDDNRVARVAVTIGPQRDTTVEITTGLNGSEEVVIAPPPLSDGQTVRRASN